MLAKDKYTVFDRKVKRYRKGIHSTCGLVDWWIYRTLMWSRGAEVDEGQPETQPPGFLDGYSDECVRMKCILFCHHTLCNGYGASWTNNLYIKIQSLLLRQSPSVYLGHTLRGATAYCYLLIVEVRLRLRTCHVAEMIDLPCPFGRQDRGLLCASLK
jgi:hypothetical protein